MKRISHYFNKYFTPLTFSFFAAVLFFSSAQAWRYGLFPSISSSSETLGTSETSVSPICFDNDVLAVAPVSSTRVVVGGLFTQVGTCIGGGAIIDPSANTLISGYDSSTMQIEGTVHASVPDGSGGVYVAGNFTKVGGVARNNLAHITSTGALDTSFLSSIPFNAKINALALSAGVLYVGGDFTTASQGYGSFVQTSNGDVVSSTTSMSGFNGVVYVSVPDGSGGWYVGGAFTSYNGTAVTRLAHLDSNYNLDTGFSPSPNGNIQSLLLDGTTLYVGGNFTQIAGVSRRNLAALSASTGIATSFDANVIGTATAKVEAIAKYNNELIIGGSFYSVNAPYKVGSGTLISTSTGLPNVNFPETDGAIYTVLSDGAGGWYIGGTFTTVGGLTRNRLAHINSSGGVSDWNPNINEAVWSMALYNTTLYIGGYFTQVNGSTTRNRLAALDTTVTAGTATTWNPNVSTASSTVYAVVIDGTTVYVGGDFTTVGGVTRNRIASIPVGSSTPNSWNPNASTASSYVKSIAVISGTIYVGGTFSTIGGQTREKLAAIGSDGLATAWNPNSNNMVNTIIANGTTSIFVGGTFTTIGGQSRKLLAEISLADGTATSFDANITSKYANPTIYGLNLVDTTLYIGGAFEFVGSDERNGFAAIDITTGLATSFNLMLGGSGVFSIGYYDGNLYIGGYIYSVGGKPRLNFAVLDASSGVATSTNLYIQGTVYSLLVDGSILYIGGNLFRINGSGRNILASINLSDYSLTTLNPAGSGNIYTMYLDSENDLLYVGGNFTSFGGSTRNRIALISTADGSLSTWNPNADATVYSIKSDGTNIYVGGNFTTIGGQSRTSLAALSPSTGNATSWDPSPSSSAYVYTLSFNSDLSTLFVGGSFTSIGASTRGYLAALNSTTGAVTSWKPKPNNKVKALLISGSTIYVGGSFSSIGGQSRNRAAALDTTTAAASTWNPNANNDVNAIAISGTTVFIAGAFTTVNGSTARNRAAAFLTTATSTPTTWNPNMNGTVNALAVIGTTVYLGGAFTTMQSTPVTRNYLGAISTSGTTTADAWNPNAGGTVHSITVDSTNMYIGGAFNSMGGTTRNNIAKVNTSATLDANFNPNSNGYVYTTSVLGTKLFVGGDVGMIAGLSRNRLAAINPQTGLVTTWNPNITGTGIYTLAVGNGNIFAGGLFTAAGGTTRNNLAAFDASTGNLVSAWDPNPSTGVVNALATSGTTLYVGGAFTSIGGSTRNRLASLDASGVATTWNPNVSTSGSVVNSLALNSEGTQIYVGGNFTTVGGLTRNRIAQISTGSNTPTSWDPNISTASSNVYALAVDGTTVYAGGNFTTVGGATKAYLVSINGSGVATTLDATIIAKVEALVFNSGKLYIGGQYTPRLAAYNTSTSTLTSLTSSGSVGYVKALTVSGNRLILGGSFTYMNDKYRNRISSVNLTTGEYGW